MIHRRSLLLGLASAFAAPAIVRADALMKVRPWGDLVAWPPIDPVMITWSEVGDATSYNIYGSIVPQDWRKMVALCNIDIDAAVRRYAAIHDVEHMLIGGLDVLPHP